MPAVLVILTIYANHSAQTTAVPVTSMTVCRDLAAAIHKQFASIVPPSGAEVYVIPKCVEAK